MSSQTQSTAELPLSRRSNQATQGAVVFASIALCLAALVAWTTGFDEVDDHLFLSTLASGKPIVTSDIYPSESAARLEPLNGTPYNLLLLIVDKVHPSYLHIWNSVEFLLLCLLIQRVLKSVVNSATAYAGCLCFVLQPSFLTAVNRLLVSERMATIAIFGMLFFYTAYSKKPSFARFYACLAAANWAIYCKEPIGGAIAIFAGCQLLVGHLKPKPLKAQDGRSLDTSLLASAIVFFAIYFGVIWPHHGESYAATRRFLPWTANFMQNVRDYALFSDPFVFFVAAPLTAIRAIAIARNRNKTHDWADSALFAGVAYAAAILLLNMSYTNYYLLPASALAWPSLVRFVQQNALNTNPKLIAISAAALVLICSVPTQISGRALIPLVLSAIVWLLLASKRSAAAFAISLAALTFVLNSLPGSLDAVAVLKTRPAAYGETIQKIQDQIEGAPDTRKRVFLAGMSASSGIEAFTSLRDNLSYLGTKSPSYDMLSCTPIDGSTETVPASPFTVFRDPRPKVPLRGDLLVFSSAQKKPCSAVGVRIVAKTGSRQLNSIAISLDQAIQLTKNRLLRRPPLQLVAPPTYTMLGTVD